MRKECWVLFYFEDCFVSLVLLFLEGFSGVSSRKFLRTEDKRRELTLGFLFFFSFSKRGIEFVCV